MALKLWKSEIDYLKTKSLFTFQYLPLIYLQIIESLTARLLSIMICIGLLSVSLVFIIIPGTTPP